MNSTKLYVQETPPGKAIDILPPSDRTTIPELSMVYYRFRKIYSTIVYKTHMVFPMGEEHYRRMHELFHHS